MLPSDNVSPQKERPNGDRLGLLCMKTLRQKICTIELRMLLSVPSNCTKTCFAAACKIPASASSGTAMLLTLQKRFTKCVTKLPAQICVSKFAVTYMIWKRLVLCPAANIAAALVLVQAHGEHTPCAYIHDKDWRSWSRPPDGTAGKAVFTEKKLQAPSHAILCSNRPQHCSFMALCQQLMHASYGCARAEARGLALLSSKSIHEKKKSHKHRPALQQMNNGNSEPGSCHMTLRFRTYVLSACLFPLSCASHSHETLATGHQSHIC